jgi:hypothetical protein
MQTHSALVELARICARRVDFIADREVARELWRMALEYQYKAAEDYFSSLSHAPRLGSSPASACRPLDEQ